MRAPIQNHIHHHRKSANQDNVGKIPPRIIKRSNIPTTRADRTRTNTYLFLVFLIINLRSSAPILSVVKYK